MNEEEFIEQYRRDARTWFHIKIVAVLFVLGVLIYLFA
jgi:hypothetical protein